MKKIIMGAALAASLLTTQAVAAEVKNGTFVGVEVGSTSYDLRSENKTFPNLSGTDSASGGSQSIKLGKYLGNMGRVYGILGRVNADGGDITNFGVGYDYLIYNNSDFTPFVGLTLGHQQFDIDGTNFDISGLTYGIELGVEYTLNKNFGIEFGYRVNLNDSKETLTIRNSSVYADQTIDYTLEGAKIWYIGANYHF